MSLPYVLDSRRLTGPSLLLDDPGAILEMRLPRRRKAAMLVTLEREVRRLLRRLKLPRGQVVLRDQGPTQMLAIAAPLDLLMPATYVNEAAFERMLAEHDGRACPDLAEVTDDLLARIARRSDARLTVLVRAAELRQVPWMLGDGDLSLGYGAAAIRFPDDDLPLPTSVDWEALKPRPLIALVTGTNGKTTTTRLLARILDDAGWCAGLCSTDYVQVGGEIVSRDDYSGPTGARMVLRDRRVTAAALEVARGGILRRGLSVREADVAVVLNVADDHLHDAGIHTLEQLAEAKMTIRKGLKRHAPLLLNAGNRHLVRMARRLDQRLQWFSLDRPAPALLASSGVALFVEEGEVRCFQRGRVESWLPVEEIGIGFSGAARHNVENALAAGLAAQVLGVPVTSICASLRRFGSRPEDNPGRANLFAIGQAKLLADYGHNPDGYDAMLQLVGRMPHRRLALMVGQAGDRTNPDIAALARRVAEARPDLVLIKALDRMRRGRAEGEVPRLIEGHLLAMGVPAERIRQHPDDASALEELLSWLTPGDLALAFLHEDQAKHLARLARLSGSAEGSESSGSV